MDKALEALGQGQTEINPPYRRLKVVKTAHPFDDIYTIELLGKVRATYTTFTSDGKKYFQIDTYGSPTREMKDKISQSIQVDKEMAKELIKLMMDTFDILN